MTESTPLSGLQASLRHGEARAEIASIGASLRVLEVAGRPLVVPYGEDDVRPQYRGVTLVPWPNRIADGRYTFDGVERQVAVNEPERGNALHGLACWLDYRIVERTSSSVRLETVLPAQAGYPHRLRIAVTYELGDDGLSATTVATNTGPTRAPYGTSTHPYVVAGPGRVDDWALELPAAQVLQVDAERLLPRGVAPVAGGPLDFGAARGIDDTFIDHAFTGLAEGRATLTAADGHGALMTWDAANSPWVQVHTGDRPEPEWHRAGLAIEPMTCPPDAFNSGVDLVVLDPGASHTFAWRLAAF